jgi:hypothetical protein
MGDRVVDCARLESVCAERHRGFESPPIRHTGKSGNLVWLLKVTLKVFHLRKCVKKHADAGLIDL